MANFPRIRSTFGVTPYNPERDTDEKRRAIFEHYQDQVSTQPMPDESMPWNVPFPPGVALQEEFDEMLQKRVVDPLSRAGYEDLGAGLASVPSAAHSMLVPQTEFDVAGTIIPLPSVAKAMKKGKFRKIRNAMKAEDPENVGEIIAKQAGKEQPVKKSELSFSNIDPASHYDVDGMIMSGDLLKQHLLNVSRGQSADDVIKKMDIKSIAPKAEVRAIDEKEMLRKADETIAKEKAIDKQLREGTEANDDLSKESQYMKDRKERINRSLSKIQELMEELKKQKPNASTSVEPIRTDKEFVEKTLDSLKEEIDKRSTPSKSVDAPKSPDKIYASPEEIRNMDLESRLAYLKENDPVKYHTIMETKLTEKARKLLDPESYPIENGKKAYGPRHPTHEGYRVLPGKEKEFQKLIAEAEKHGKAWEKIKDEQYKLEKEGRIQLSPDNAEQDMFKLDQKRRMKDDTARIEKQLQDSPKPPKGDPEASLRGPFQSIRSQLDVAPARMDERGRSFENIGQSDFMPYERPQVGQFEDVQKRNYVERDLGVPVSELGSLPLDAQRMQRIMDSKGKFDPLSIPARSRAIKMQNDMVGNKSYEQIAAESRAQTEARELQSKMYPPKPKEPERFGKIKEQITEKSLKAEPAGKRLRVIKVGDGKNVKDGTDVTDSFGTQENLAGMSADELQKIVDATGKRYKVIEDKYIPSGQKNTQGKYYVTDWAGNEIDELGTYDSTEDAYDEITEWLRSKGVDEADLDLEVGEFDVRRRKK